MTYDNEKKAESIGNGTTEKVNSYAESRQNMMYYKILRSLLKAICRTDDTICDVGSNGVDMLSFLPC
jgi:hypothetical protein